MRAARTPPPPQSPPAHGHCARAHSLAQDHPPQPPASSFLLRMRSLPPAQLPRMRRRLRTRPRPSAAHARPAPPSCFTCQRLTFWQRGGACAVCLGVPSSCLQLTIWQGATPVAVPFKQPAEEGGRPVRVSHFPVVRQDRRRNGGELPHIHLGEARAGGGHGRRQHYLPPVPVEVSSPRPIPFASFPRTAPPTSPEKDTAACCPLAVSSYCPKLTHPGSPQHPPLGAAPPGPGRRTARARGGAGRKGGGGKGGKGVERGGARAPLPFPRSSVRNWLPEVMARRTSPFCLGDLFWCGVRVEGSAWSWRRVLF